MTVRAKFKVESVTAREDGATVKLVPVTTSGARASAENARFCKYTPAGEISLTTINLDAAAQFKPGAEMFVDFHNIDPHTGEPVQAVHYLTPPPPARVDWYGLAIEARLPTWALGEPGHRLPPELRHAKHVDRPHPDCAVCQAKGRV